MNNKKSKRRVGRNTITIAIFCAIGMVIGSLNAAVVDVTVGSTTGYTMTDGNTYVVQNSVSFSNSTVGGSGMSVADGATVALYVPQGVTLTASGADGEGRTGGGAGIRVPETSTLIITGEGAINACGGNAGNGENGGAGGNAQSQETYEGGRVVLVTAGTGGGGGAGGGGGGAGIGGCGRLGGNPSGGAGENGENMGTVYVLGAIVVGHSTPLRGIECPTTASGHLGD